VIHWSEGGDVPRVQQALNDCLCDLLREDPSVLVIGEDILDPYGGAFKVTKGLSTRFPDRVFGTPISEAAIVGLGTGLALRGFKPIVEIMFGDFITLIADQLINQVTKMTWMYNEDLPLSLVVRTPMGGRRGYGPTHSQTIEKHFFGVPGLLVCAISTAMDPGAILRHAVLGARRPVLLIENKLLYAQRVFEPRDLESLAGLRHRSVGEGFPTVILEGAQPDVTLVTYGGMLDLTLQAARHLERVEGLVCDIVIAHQLSPVPLGPIRESVQRTKRLVVVEEGVREWGWGAEVVSQLSEVQMEAPAQRVGARAVPIPASRSLEDSVLPQVGDIVSAAIATVDESYGEQAGVLQ
jgi:pyruvate/2-oxoglutarate/acetoin dehydrogenase E1 component